MGEVKGESLINVQTPSVRFGDIALFLLATAGADFL